MEQTPSVLITGAAGFIGAAVARDFISMGYRVDSIDNLSTGFNNNVPSEVNLYNGNVQSEQLIQSLQNKKYEAIIHIAGQSSGEISFDNPVYDLQTNTQSTLLLLQLALNSGCKKFIYASTMSVYGDQLVMPVKESAILSPKSFYAVGKLASENYLKIYQKYGIDCTALRLFNVYGPGQNMDNLRQGMVSIYLSQALKDDRIIVKGATDRFRDMVYIDDVVKAFRASFLSGTNGYHCYNVCTGKKTLVSDVVDMIRKGVKKDIQIEIREGTPGDMHGIVGENSLIKNELGWVPQVAFAEGVHNMIEWALKELKK